MTEKEKQTLSEKPQLMEEWNWKRNTDENPLQLSLESHKKVWWTCSKGHDWQAEVKTRNAGTGCPYCSGKRAINGENDLQTINPYLANEWNSEKNNGLTPMDVLPNSGKKVWWRCNKGHEWQARIADRNNGNGCPFCSGKKVLKGFNDLQTVNPSLTEEWNYLKNDELTPTDVSPNSHKIVWWICSKGHEWQAEIKTRNVGFGCPYCSGKRAIKGENDLQTINPHLANEWDFEKNNGLTPMDVLPSSGKLVWWKCSKGHEWQAKIYSRNSGTGCPICASERNTSFPEYALIYYFQKCGLGIIHSFKEKGYELDVYIPSKRIAIEYDGYYWHKDKIQEDIAKNLKCVDDGIKLYRIREGLPPLNDSSIDYVIQKNQKDLSTVIEKLLNDIAETSVIVDLKKDAIAIESLREHIEKEISIMHYNPKVVEEWNYEKNGSLKPEFFNRNSHKKVWWKCQKGHEWQATIDNRSKGHGCPYCSGRVSIIGENDLQTINPSLLEEWNFEKNREKSPSSFKANSGKIVWWRCNKGHEWQARIADRNNGRGCPFCSGKKLLKGFNDLQSVNPALAEEWNYKKIIVYPQLTCFLIVIKKCGGYVKKGMSGKQ